MSRLEPASLPRDEATKAVLRAVTAAMPGADRECAPQSPEAALEALGRRYAVADEARLLEVAVADVARTLRLLKVAVARPLVEADDTPAPQTVGPRDLPAVLAEWSNRPGAEANREMAATLLAHDASEVSS